jgi:hypothetical protein
VFVLGRPFFARVAQRATAPTTGGNIAHADTSVDLLIV